MTLPYAVHNYAARAHQGFVQASWCKGAKEPWDALAARLAAPGVHCLVASVADDPDSLLGWACVDRVQGAVVWAYVRDLYGRVRHRGIGVSLLIALGIDPSRDTPCLYWSRSADALVARGYRFFHQPEPVLGAIRLLEMNGFVVTRRRTRRVAA